MADWRNINFEATPALLFHWQSAPAYIIRREFTAWRGPFVMYHDRRAYAVAVMVDCQPCSHPLAADGSPEKFRWVFDRVQVLDVHLDAPQSRSGLWESPRGLEPFLCNSTLWDELERMFPDYAVTQEHPFPLPEVRTPVLEPMAVPALIERVEAVGVNKRGQLEMF